jgi:hypothetical protein
VPKERLWKSVYFARSNWVQARTCGGKSSPRAAVGRDRRYLNATPTSIFLRQVMAQAERRDVVEPGEEAMADFAKRWRSWLELGRVRGKESHERVRLP